MLKKKSPKKNPQRYKESLASLLDSSTSPDTLMEPTWCQQRSYLTQKAQ